ncbi:hypothetical protein GALMADRAFT_74705 [Galerina marginata CBS 339.88]|uniref:SET domain-containing protein n=1 Tax=Galerina marginata (strain CBS 339.88) TaxID=685588 RepID=A0A067SVH4_GALM3|nr:hypothetical protein GALMADRAFT_74705 [Galerina marginata CBS 339.88]
MKARYDVQGIIFTTVPHRPSGFPADPDGYTEWIVLSPTKHKVLEAPGYPQRVPKPAGPPAYAIRSAPNMGTGLFATKDIKCGELILAERPLLVSPRNIVQRLPCLANLPADCDVSTATAVVSLEFERQLEMSMARMSPENRAAYKSLLVHPKEGCGPLLGVIQTNSYGVDELFDGPELLPSSENVYAVVTKIGSRINHSCRPNILHKFSLASFSLQFYAEVDIKKGDQFFYSYCAENQSVADRQNQLSGYGFVCTCPACANATPESDKLREEYAQQAKQYCQTIARWNSSTLKRSESAIDPILKFREALIKEGLNASGNYRDLTTRIVQFYSKRGLTEKANAYREEVESYRNGFGAS